MWTKSQELGYSAPTVLGLLSMVHTSKAEIINGIIRKETAAYFNNTWQCFESLTSAVGASYREEWNALPEVSFHTDSFACGTAVTHV